MNINELADQFGYTDNEGVYFTADQLEQFVLCIDSKVRIECIDIIDEMAAKHYKDDIAYALELLREKIFDRNP